MAIVLVVLIIALAVWWGLVQHGAASLERLEESGFDVDHVIGTNTKLALDEDQRKVAYIGVSEVLVYDYEQVLGWETRVVDRDGWTNKSEPTQIHYLVVFVKDDQQSEVRIEGIDRREINRWSDQLDGWLSSPRASRQ